MTVLANWFSRRDRQSRAEEEERYFSVDLITCLLLASCGEFRREEITERAVALKRAVPFEMRDYGDKLVSTEDEVRAAVGGLLDEGVREGWIEAVAMRYADRCRQDMPLRLSEVLAGRPSLKGPLQKILAHVGYPGT